MWRLLLINGLTMFTVLVNRLKRLKLGLSQWNGFQNRWFIFHDYYIRQRNRMMQKDLSQDIKMKKIKLNDPKMGKADIPSSNLIIDKGKKPKQNVKLTQSMNSIPNLPLKMYNNPSTVLDKMQLPKKFKEAMGDTIYDLQKYQEKLEKKQKYEEKKNKIKKLIYQRHKAKQESQISQSEKAQIERKKKDKQQEREKKEEQMKESMKPVNFKMDEKGRMLDQEGNIINIKQQSIQTLQINKNKLKEQKVKEMFKIQRINIQNEKNQAFYDKSISISKKDQKKRHLGLNFIEEGTYLKRAETMRNQQSSQLNLNINQVNNRFKSGQIKHHDPIPEVEWWDIPYLHNQQSYFDQSLQQMDKEQQIEYLENQIKILKENPVVMRQNFYDLRKISRKIENNDEIKNNNNQQNVVIPVYLTKDEKKKIRKRQRQEKEKEKQDKIKLGLIEPEGVKLKMSNMYKVMGDEAVQDPSKIEKEVKKQIQERLKQHMLRNQMRKLTKEQKNEKILRKLKKDSASETRVCIFRLKNLSNRAHRFKIDKNATQMQLHGYCVIPDRKMGLGLPVLVVVEGGPKAIKFYKKLMMHRIKWGQSIKEIISQEQQQQQNDDQHCILVWEGIVKDHSFSKWQVVEIKSELEGRKLFIDRSCENYWDMTLNYISPK